MICSSVVIIDKTANETINVLVHRCRERCVEWESGRDVIKTRESETKTRQAEIKTKTSKKWS